MSKYIGGPAFPCLVNNLTGETVTMYGVEVPTGSRYEHGGMSLRDYFAGQALHRVANANDIKDSAYLAYKIADAMLAERDK